MDKNASCFTDAEKVRNFMLDIYDEVENESKMQELPYVQTEEEKVRKFVFSLYDELLDTEVIEEQEHNNISINKRPQKIQ